MINLDKKLESVKALIGELIRVGTVTSVDDKNGMARVLFKDRNDVVSYQLPVLVNNTLENKDYFMPAVKEQVVCLFLPIGIEQGFILGSFYSDVTKPEAGLNKDKRSTKFQDGTTVTYDKGAHLLTVDVPADGGEVVVNAQSKVTVNSPEIDLGEDASLEPVVLGEKLSTWIVSQLKSWLDTHQHIGNMGSPTSGAMTSPSGPFDPGEGASGGNVYSGKNRSQ